MKMKKILSVALGFLVLIGVVAVAGQGVYAASLSSVTAGLTTSGMNRVPGNTTGTQTFLDAAPSVTVTADGLKPFGAGNRISADTTQIGISVSGQFTTKDKKGSIKSYYYALLDRTGQMIAESPVKNVAVPSAEVSTANDSYTFTNLDLKGLRDQGPIYIAYCFKSTSSDFVNEYYTTKIGKNLYPKITTSPLTTTTTVISGTGTAGDIITADSITTNTATVGSDGKWSLTVDADALKDATKLTVTETNEFGDRGTAEKDVTAPPVTIAADKDTIDLTSDDVTKLEAMNDSDFAAWVESAANITGKSGTDNATIKTDTTGLADALKKVADNGSMTIDFYATDGTDNSTTKTITLVKPGTVKFGTVSDNISFGTHGVPTATTVFGPTAAWNVNINDTRTAGSKWYLYASGTKMTSGTHTMPGYMMYRDANNQTSDLTKSTLIDSGTRGTDANTAVTTNWTTDPKDTSKAGIFLDVEPGVYADSSTDYTGTVNWSLQDTPAQ